MKTSPLTIKLDVPEGAVFYTNIVDAIAAAIQSNKARPGQRLPTQRELARRFGVALGTVSRAYAEAARRGLVSGTVGRGTFVAPNASSTVEARRSQPLECIDLTINRPPVESCSRQFAGALARISRRRSMAPLLSHQPTAGRLEDRGAAAALIRGTGLVVEPERVVLANGVQHALAVVLGALASPGDLLVTEGINYPGIRLAAKIYNLRLQGLAMDGEGLLPDALREVCEQERPPRFLFCTPTAQNPTSSQMGQVRREAIAELAVRYKLIVIEDDIYGLMPEQPALPITALIPERSYYLTGTSKCLGAGIRLGHIVAPSQAAGDLITAAQATSWMASPLMAAIVTDWVNEGVIDRIIAANRLEAKTRQSLAADKLAGLSFSSHPFGFHLWLQLPEPWRQAEFVAQARKKALLIPSSEIFAIGRTEIPHAVRLSFGSVSDIQTLADGLQQLAILIAKGPQFQPAIE
jgi:DNA-binding transcriptional MocR family regulator